MKIRLLLSLAGLAVGFAFPTLAQEQNTVDPEVRQQIEAAVLKYQEACNNYDAAATAALFTLDAVEVVGSEMADVSNRQRDIRYLGMELGAMEGPPRNDLCS